MVLEFDEQIQASAIATVRPEPYTLSTAYPLKWPAPTTTNNSSLEHDLPFPLTDTTESAESFVQRTYLLFLWFPESLMTLSSLIPTLLRVQPKHTLVPLITPLLLTPRAASAKYTRELPTIISDGGGAGEDEEHTMWTLLPFEKDSIAEDGGGSKEGWTVADDEGSRKRWLERLERREIQIQILLHFLLLSLTPPAKTENADPTDSPIKTKNNKTSKSPKRPLSPNPIPTPSKIRLLSTPSKSRIHPVPVPTTPSPKKSRASASPSKPPQPSLATVLEAYMDKLATWQLLSTLPPSKDATKRRVEGGSREERDWMQVFCEDVVEPLFTSTQPTYTTLLRSKLFPSSPFSDSEFESDLDADEPLEVGRSLSSRPPPSRHPSAFKRERSLSRARSVSRGDLSTSLPSTFAQDRSLSRAHSISRGDLSASLPSRSLSRAPSLSSFPQSQSQPPLTLAEALAADTIAMHLPSNRRRVLSREVSMSRVIRPKPRPSIEKRKEKGGEDGKREREEREKEREREKKVGRTLVQATPTRPRVGVPSTSAAAIDIPLSPLQSRSQKKVELEEEAGTQIPSDPSSNPDLSSTSNNPDLDLSLRLSLSPLSSSSQAEEEEEEDELLLRGSSSSSSAFEFKTGLDGSEEEEEREGKVGLGMQTPSKPARKGKGVGKGRGRRG